MKEGEASVGSLPFVCGFIALKGILKRRRGGGLCQKES